MTVLLHEKSAKPCQNIAHSQKQTEILWSLLLTVEMQRKIQGYPPPPKAIVRSGNLVIEDLCRADNAAMPCVWSQKSLKSNPQVTSKHIYKNHPTLFKGLGSLKGKYEIKTDPDVQAIQPNYTKLQSNSPASKGERRNPQNGRNWHYQANSTYAWWHQLARSRGLCGIQRIWRSKKDKNHHYIYWRAGWLVCWFNLGKPFLQEFFVF